VGINFFYGAMGIRKEGKTGICPWTPMEIGTKNQKFVENKSAA